MSTRTAPDVITALARARVGKVALALPIALYLGWNAQVFVRAALPLAEPYGASFPWGMFKDPSAEDREIVATGKTKDGHEYVIPLHEIFHYRRGGTDLIIPDHVKSLRRDRMAHRVTRKRFALFLADWMKEHRGVELDWVTLKQRRVHIDTGVERYRHLGNYDVFNRNVSTPWTTTDLCRWCR